MNSTQSSKATSSTVVAGSATGKEGGIGCLGILIVLLLLALLGWILPDPDQEGAAETSVEATTTTPSELTWEDNLRSDVSATDLTMFLCDGLRQKLEERVELIWSRLAESEVPSQDAFASADFVRQVSWANATHSWTTDRLLEDLSDPLLEAGSKDTPTNVQRTEFLNDSISECGLTLLSNALAESARALDDRLQSMIWSANNLPWYPDGFSEQFSGVAFRKSERGLDCYSCNGIVYEVISAFDCPNQLYVEANFIDGNGTIFDWDNDVVRSLSAGQIAFIELQTYISGFGQKTVSLTKADCF